VPAHFSFLTSLSARILLALHKQHCAKTVNNIDGSDGNEIVACGIARDMVRLAKWATMESKRLYDEELCPFPLHAAYHVAITYVDMDALQQNEEYSQALCQLKSLFKVFGQRWRLGGM
jgi:hypothetical protein